jgi:hypothetical protein
MLSFWWRKKKSECMCAAKPVRTLVASAILGRLSRSGAAKASASASNHTWRVLDVGSGVSSDHATLTVARAMSGLGRVAITAVDPCHKSADAARVYKAQFIRTDANTDTEAVNPNHS